MFSYSAAAILRRHICYYNTAPIAFGHAVIATPYVIAANIKYAVTTY